MGKNTNFSLQINGATIGGEGTGHSKPIVYDHSISLETSYLASADAGPLNHGCNIGLCFVLTFFIIVSTI